MNSGVMGYCLLQMKKKSKISQVETVTWNEYTKAFFEKTSLGLLILNKI